LSLMGRVLVLDGGSFFLDFRYMMTNGKSRL
jgi:hypothetical protein